jgi:prophage DNA circulation protein
MSWRDNLQPASFRGVPFKVASSDSGFGRRNKLHQFPFQDIPYLEDLGEDATDFILECYIVQNPGNDFDYFGERDALISALKKEGAGTLVHPYYGEFTVGVNGKARIRENATADGGRAVISVNFVVAGNPVNPSDKIDPEAAIDAAVDEALEDMLGDFEDTFVSEDQPGFSLLSAIGVINDSFQMIRSSISSIQDKISSSASEALGELAELQSNTASLINSPANIGNSIISSFNTFTSLTGIFGDTVNPFNVSKNLNSTCTNACLAITRFGEILGSATNPSAFGGQIEDVPVTTSTRARQKANQTAIVNMVRNVAVITAAQIAVRTDYVSAEEANEALTLIGTAIDEQALKMANEVDGTSHKDFQILFESDASYSALENVRDVFVDIMIEKGATLAQVVNYEVPPTTQSTIWLAYNRYKDASRESDIFDRNINLIDHPGFLPQGETIEILSE